MEETVQPRDSERNGREEEGEEADSFEPLEPEPSEQWSPSFFHTRPVQREMSLEMIDLAARDKGKGEEGEEGEGEEGEEERDPFLPDGSMMVITAKRNTFFEESFESLVQEDELRRGKEEQETVKDEGPFYLALQSSPSLLIAGVGLFLAGWLFDIVQVLLFLLSS